MAKGKHEAPSPVRRASASCSSSPAAPRVRRKRRNLLPLLAALTLIAGMAVGGTMAYLTDSSDSLSDTYVAGKVDCQVQSDYSVKNTGNVAAYVRVTIVPSYVNAAGNVCTNSVHQDSVPATPDGWIYNGNFFYYYPQKLAPEEQTMPLIIPATGEETDGCTLKYEVTAYAIQAEPAEAVTGAWGYTPGN